MIIIIKLASGLALIVIAASFNLILTQRLFAQSIPYTGNPQNMVGGGLQPTRADVQTAPNNQVLADVYQYDPSGSQNLKINLQEAAKPSGDNQTETQPAKTFPWQVFGLGALGLLALFGLAKLFDRPSGNIFTR